MRAFRFQIPFAKPVELQGVTHAVREGVLIERDGQWAEASPLPGFSAETLGDVIRGLRGESAPPPALRFAMQSLDHPLETTLAVPVNTLLPTNVLDAPESLELTSSVSAAKLKVGRKTLKAEIEMVQNVRRQLPQETKLRLDANQAWSFDQALEFVRALEGLNYEYIEEPLQEHGRLEELFSLTGVKYALDETLREGVVEDYPNAAALVCKPTILGGRDVALRLAAAGKPLVFSAAFETGVGLVRVMQLATQFAPQTEAGLDTLSWLAGDVLTESPRVVNGFMNSSDRWTVDETRLERVEL